MAQIITPKKQRLEIAHILHKHMGDYQNQYRLWPEHKKIVTDLLNCRTAHLGGHIDRCDNCGTVRIIYHSCRPLNYFHVVFTLPHELNTIILNNKKVMLNCLFAAASKTLLAFGKNELTGTPGFLAILHTWDQKLKAHFHLHCLVAGGVVSKDNRRFIACAGDYLFNQQALSLVFRGKFMQRMGIACQSNKLRLGADAYRKLKNTLFTKTWVVSVRDPVNQPQHVLEYLARYTHRVAIANSRIKSLKDSMVTFTAKNRKKNRIEPVTISAVEFIRRFLLHSLPKGFVRIRHYGFLANRNRRANLKVIRKLLKLPTQLLKMQASLEQIMLQLTGIDITTCPCCNRGKMQLLVELPSYRARAPNNLAGVAA
jgi:hypothetical protein